MKPNAGRSKDQLDATRPQSASDEVAIRSHIVEASYFTAVEVEQTISLPADMMRKSNIQLLRIVGDSMIGDHLIDGDLVIVEKRDTGRDGELVLAFLRKGGAEVRRFFRDGQQIRLEPTDPSCEAVFLDENDVTIRGVVVGILRKHRG
jgi:repressor LexA